jgi:PEP-CTERM motif
MKRIACGFGILALFIGAKEARATPVVVGAIRDVTIGDFANTLPGPASPFTGVGPFSDNVTANLGDVDVSAQQSSNIDAAAGQFSGNGTATVGFSVLEFDEVFAGSHYEVFFDLSSPHAYSLTGTLAASIDGGQGIALFLLIGPTPLDFAAIDFGTVNLADTGVLAAGFYRLIVSADMGPGPEIDPNSFMGGVATWNFNLELEETTTQVPEPVTLSLLALGLAGVGLARRRTSGRAL